MDHSEKTFGILGILGFFLKKKKVNI